MKLRKTTNKNQDKIKRASLSSSMLKNYKLMVLTVLFSLALIISGCGEIEGKKNMKEFNECLAENGMVIYGSEFCPVCTALVEELGGYEAAKPVYVECTEPENEQRCEEEKQTDVFPEVQMDGEVQDWPLEVHELGELAGCSLPE